MILFWFRRDLREATKMDARGVVFHYKRFQP